MKFFNLNLVYFILGVSLLISSVLAGWFALPWLVVFSVIFFYAYENFKLKKWEKNFLYVLTVPFFVYIVAIIYFLIKDGIGFIGDSFCNSFFIFVLFPSFIVLLILFVARFMYSDLGKFFGGWNKFSSGTKFALVFSVAISCVNFFLVSIYFLNREFDRIILTYGFFTGLSPIVALLSETLAVFLKVGVSSLYPSFLIISFLVLIFIYYILGRIVVDFFS